MDHSGSLLTMIINPCNEPLGFRSRILSVPGAQVFPADQLIALTREALGTLEFPLATGKHHGRSVGGKMLLVRNTMESLKFREATGDSWGIPKSPTGFQYPVWSD